MEEKSSANSNLMLGGFGVFLNANGLMHVNHQQNPDLHQRFMVHPQQVQDILPFKVGNMQESEQPVSFLDCNNKGERVKNSASNDDRSNVVEEGVDGHNDGGREKKECPWQRVKWTDKMVKRLITAVSYIREDASSDCSGGGRKNSLLLPKKGKWKAISMVMGQRGYHVSPQQCEDKFNDLNKRYKRLNDILGRGTSCNVVENPVLLDLMDLSDEAKENVRKILSSKQLFYQEMCSYHNGNRLYLPHDWALQQSLQLALYSNDKNEPHVVRPYKSYDFDVEGEDAESDGRNDHIEEDCALHKGNGGTLVFPVVSAKRKKQGEECEIRGFGNSLIFSDCNIRSDPHPPNDHTNVSHVFTECGEGKQLQDQILRSRSLQLEEQKLQIQAQMMELEKQRFKWLRFSWQEDRELGKMRLENKCMKLENERLALQLKFRETSADYN